jgi:hypothetical protein
MLQTKNNLDQSFDALELVTVSPLLLPLNAFYILGVN